MLPLFNICMTFYFSSKTIYDPSVIYCLNIQPLLKQVFTADLCSYCKVYSIVFTKGINPQKVITSSNIKYWLIYYLIYLGFLHYLRHGKLTKGLFSIGNYYLVLRFKSIKNGNVTFQCFTSTFYKKFLGP